MVSPVFIAALITILPAAAAMWRFLSRYEGYFEDARVFFSLIFGFFAGLVAAALETIVFQFGSASFQASAGLGAALLFFVVGYAFFESGIKSMVLGLKRFRGRRDTPYYGFAFGLGFGAMLMLQLMAFATRLVQEDYSLASGRGIVVLLAFALVPVGAVLAHGASGAWIGRGVAEKKLWKGWGIATLLQIPVQVALWYYIQDGLAPLFALAILGYGVVLLMWTRKKVLDEVVPKDIQDRLRRERRREARGHTPAIGAAMAADSEE